MADYLALKNQHLTITFPRLEDAQLLRRLIRTCPTAITLSAHARNTLRNGLDCTASAKKK
jgi:hypothetical protein